MCSLLVLFCDESFCCLVAYLLPRLSCISFSRIYQRQLLSDAGCGSSQLAQFAGFWQMSPCFSSLQFIHISTSNVHVLMLWLNCWHLKHLLGRGMYSRAFRELHPIFTVSGSLHLLNVNNIVPVYFYLPLSSLALAFIL